MTEQIIENRMPPVGNHFPTTHYKDKKRKSGYSARHCKKKWLEKYYFMCFSPMNNGIYFLACTLFLAEIKYYKDDFSSGHHVGTGNIFLNIGNYMNNVNIIKS